LWCFALPGTKLSESEAYWAMQAMELVPRGDGFVLTPTVVDWGADYVAFAEIGDRVNGNGFRFNKHHAIEVSIAQSVGLTNLL
jgi:hypothetical protein